MPRVKLTIAYDGAAYAGWQVQPARRTVQGEVERAWREITGEEVRLTASGRTDAGVHALGQVAGVETQTMIATEQIARALNAHLPDDIVVVSSEAAPPNFHATHDALRKTYRYQIHNSRTRPLMDRGYVWHFPAGELDAELMRQGGQHLLGRHDFVSFESTGSERATTVRTILRLDITQRGERFEIEVTGDGFLYNMVRAIAGTLVEVGRGAKPPEWVAEVIAARSRKAAGPTAPPQGLVLVSVEY
ncbi:tRNA pseudouridine synthase A [Posidoniimonas polymericola]|uniref:tRNA pseudouridine synthase A n=1 Tax=Posidoniimonas polymericola TaxID=2528002 RepID=A0A5C5YRB0_9BACT|nr:tRNA pseudouridine(38-40) synthase TruA [Posidoniimonas polymericola]TWT77409.1 tRNA pseudouridine synthase A [Posidoniimonas polymericola]